MVGEVGDLRVIVMCLTTDIISYLVESILSIPNILTGFKIQKERYRHWVASR